MDCFECGETAQILVSFEDTQLSDFKGFGGLMALCKECYEEKKKEGEK